MSKCNYIRLDGARCQAPAISGGKRCSIHRLDGGPKPLGSRLDHRARLKSTATNKEETMAEHLLAIHRIKAAMDRGQSLSNLRYLSTQIGRRIGCLFTLLEDEANRTEKAQPLLQAALERGIPNTLRREREIQLASHQRRVSYADTTVRSQRYWAIYGVIVWSIKVRNRIPSRQEIQDVLKVGRAIVYRNLDQLEQDGLIYRRRGLIYLQNPGYARQ